MLTRRHPWTARWGSLIDRCMDKAGEQEHSLIGTHRWDGPEGVVTEAVTDFVGWTQLASASKASLSFISVSPAIGRGPGTGMYGLCKYVYLPSSGTLADVPMRAKAGGMCVGACVHSNSVNIRVKWIAAFVLNINLFTHYMDLRY